MWTNPCRKIKSNWVSHWAEFKWKGKTRFWTNIAWHTHAYATLIQPCLSKCHGEIKILVSINFRSSLVLKISRAISLFPYFCFWISTRYKNKCGGDLSELSYIYTWDLPQHVHNTERTRMQKAKTPMFLDVVSGVLGIIIWSSFDRVELLMIHIIPWYCPWNVRNYLPRLHHNVVAFSIDAVLIVVGDQAATIEHFFRQRIRAFSKVGCNHD